MSISTSALVFAFRSLFGNNTSLNIQQNPKSAEFVSGSDEAAHALPNEGCTKSPSSGH